MKTLRIMNLKWLWDGLKGLVVTIIVIAVLIVIKNEFLNYASNNNGNEQIADHCESGNIALVKIHGAIVNYKLSHAEDPNGAYDSDSVASEDVIKMIEQVEDDERIKGIIVEIDSPGGIPEAAEEIMNSLLACSKPVAAYVRQSGCSAAYMIATGADKIYANRLSDVGGIGITLSYLDNSKKNLKDGLTYNQLSTGKFKDAGNSDKELTGEEKAYFMDELNKAHRIFIEFVAANRNMDVELVKKLADGSSLIAQDAKDAGLIDGVGGLSEAKAFLKDKIGQEVKLCDYGQ